MWPRNSCIDLQGMKFFYVELGSFYLISFLTEALLVRFGKYINLH